MRLHLIAAAAFVLPAFGCSEAIEQDEASATATSALQAQSQGGVTDGVLDVDAPDGLAPDPEDAAKAVAEKDARALRPAGCAVKTRDGAVVTIALHGCTGPFGKIALDGTLVATFSKTATNVLHVDIADGGDLAANGASFHYAAGVDVTYAPGTRKLDYHGHSDGTTKRGVAFDRHTDLAIVADVDKKCVSIDGVSKGSLGRFDLDLTIDGFHGCESACPTAGSAKATLRTPNREIDVEVDFDGSDRAHVKAPKHAFDVALACEDAEAAQ
ncbi:MAG TPA: hypothetical protein VIF62_14995 [Labilithrix sp.]|jgi:hypothetical protein